MNRTALLILLGLSLGFCLISFTKPDRSNVHAVGAPAEPEIVGTPEDPKPIDAALKIPMTMPDPICDAWEDSEGHAVRCIWYIAKEETQL